MNDSPQVALARLASQRGESLAALSRLIGRNDSYLQQYVKRGSPRVLPEKERKILCDYLDVAEEMLGGPARPPAAPALVVVAAPEVRASAGSGASNEERGGLPRLAFHPALLRRLTASAADDLALVRVDGDSMLPTLADGDDVLVDHRDGAARLRDGIYVLRIDDHLLVKRVARAPQPGRIMIRSDNPAFADWPDCAIDEIAVVGRVIWAGRRIG